MSFMHFQSFPMQERKRKVRTEWMKGEEGGEMSLFLWGRLRKMEQKGEVTIPEFKQTGAFMNEVVHLCGAVRLVKSRGGQRDVPIMFCFITLCYFKFCRNS